MLTARTAFAVMMLVGFAGCTRRADQAPLRDATFFSGPTSKDTELSVPALPHDAMASRLRFESPAFATADYLRLVDELDQLGRLEHDDRIAGLAVRLHDALYTDGKLPAVPLDRSLYADAAIGEGEAMLRPVLNETDTKLRLALARFEALLDRSHHDFPWPAAVPDFPSALLVADRYVAWLEGELPSLGLDEKLLPALRTAIDTEWGKFRSLLSRALGGFAASHGLAEALAPLEGLLHDLNIQLPPGQTALLAKADDLSRQLAHLGSSQDALSMLVFIWRSVPPEQRQTLQQLSPDLFKYLSSKSDNELDCLAAEVCFNPILDVSKAVVLSKLSSYGVEKLRQQVDTAAHDFLLQLILKEIANILPRVPDEAKTEVEKAAEPYFALLHKIQGDFGGFARERLRAWAPSRFPAPLRGLEPATIGVRLQSREDVEVSVPADAGGYVKTGAETIGLSLAIAPRFLPEDPERRKAALVEPLLKLLAVGGFHQLGGRLFPSLLFALDGTPGELFDIRALLQGSTSFAVPDSFRAKGWTLDRASARADASVAAQAEMLRGIAAYIRLARDWERTEVDESLGSLNASELLPEVPSGIASYPLFPKPILFALTVGNAGAELQNVVRRLSPAFLLMPKNELIWGDHYQEIHGANVSTVAGMVPIIDGKRAGFVRTADVARYVLALDEFFAASEGVENTRSPPLLQKNDEGVTVLSQLLEARQKLRLLQMALTNYLVYVSQRSDGAHAATHVLSDLLAPSTEPLRLEDQALAIRALLASSRSLEIPVFRWAAVDTYYGMNRFFFDRDAGFYAPTVGSDGQATGKSGLHEITLALLAGEEVAPFLPAAARAQWERISRPWLRALEDF